MHDLTHALLDLPSDVHVQADVSQGTAPSSGRPLDQVVVESLHISAMLEQLMLDMMTRGADFLELQMQGYRGWRPNQKQAQERSEGLEASADGQVHESSTSQVSTVPSWMRRL